MPNPNHVDETLAQLYSFEINESQLVPAQEAEIAYSLHSELGDAGLDTFDAREAILTGHISFAQVALPDSKSLNPEQLAKVQTAVVKYVLTSGANGFKDGIASITFDNGNPFKGTFVEVGSGDRTFSYEIEESGGNYTSSISALSGVEG